MGKKTIDETAIKLEAAKEIAALIFAEFKKVIVLAGTAVVELNLEFDEKAFHQLLVDHALARKAINGYRITLGESEPLPFDTHDVKLPV
jgi:hypothetical protein